MTKTISLSDEAYEALVAAKRPGESFSEVARRLARLAALDAILDPARPPAVREPDAATWERETYADRDLSRAPRVGFP